MGLIIVSNYKNEIMFFCLQAHLCSRSLRDWEGISSYNGSEYKVWPHNNVFSTFYEGTALLLTAKTTCRVGRNIACP